MIEVKHLTKRYGSHTAVDDLSFTIEKGQIYGFLGPNGAGKSTTMNMITGCLAASEGEITIDGFDIFEQSTEAKKRIGYLPEIPPLYIDCTPREYLLFVAEAKGVARGEIQEQIEHAMEVTQITGVQNRLIKNLSKGYKQRVGIAQALLGNPEIIILDEPTVGLDPIQIIEIRDLIKDLGKEHTVILSSHILSEVQAVCQTILIIAKGKLVACDSPENLEKLFAGTQNLQMTVEGSPEEVAGILSPISEITNMQITKEEHKCSIFLETNSGKGEELCKKIFWSFSNAQHAILEMHTIKASLEDIFIELTSVEENEASDEKAKKKEEKDESDI